MLMYGILLLTYVYISYANVRYIVPATYRICNVYVSYANVRYIAPAAACIWARPDRHLYVPIIY